MAIPLLGGLGLGLKILKFGKSLISPDNKLADAVKVIQEIRGKGDRSSEFESAVRVKEVEADKDVALAQIRASSLGWRDEFALGLVSYPYIMNFLIGTAGVIDALFLSQSVGVNRFDLAFERFDETIKALNDFPLWYELLFGSIVSACFGIRGYGIYKEKKNGNGHNRTPGLDR